MSRYQRDERLPPTVKEKPSSGGGGCLAGIQRNTDFLSFDFHSSCSSSRGGARPHPQQS